MENVKTMQILINETLWVNMKYTGCILGNELFILTIREIDPESKYLNFILYFFLDM